MKYLLLCFLFIGVVSCNEKKEEVKVEAAAATTNAENLPKELEDCDDKAKKVEIEPQEIKLQGGDTGCSLDEVQSNK